MAARRLRRSPSGSRVELDDEPLNPSQWERLIVVPDADLLLPTSLPHAEIFDETLADPIPINPQAGGTALFEVEASLSVSFSSGTAYSGTVGGTFDFYDEDDNQIGGFGWVLPRARSPVGQADSNYAQGALVTWTSMFHILLTTQAPELANLARIWARASATQTDVVWLFDRQAFRFRRLR